jgi:hypothetical protein
LEKIDGSIFETFLSHNSQDFTSDYKSWQLQHSIILSDSEVFSLYNVNSAFSSLYDETVNEVMHPYDMIEDYNYIVDYIF